MIFIAAWLAHRALHKPKAPHPFRTVRISLHGRPMAFSGPALAEMMAHFEVAA